MPYYQDGQTKALLFFKNEPDLPGNWERLHEPDGYHRRGYDSLDAIWRDLFRQKADELAAASAAIDIPPAEPEAIDPPPFAKRKGKADAQG